MQQEKNQYMYHEHPLKILKHSVKNIWLLIFPILRGIRSASLDFDAFYTWICGAWFDLIILIIFIGFGYFRWLFTWYRFDENHIRLMTGIFVKTVNSIPYKNISAVSSQYSFYLRPLKAAKVSIDTCAGTFGTVDMSLLVRRRDLKMLQKKFPEMKLRDKNPFKFKSKWYTIVFFSFIFSSSLSGVIYLATFIFQAGRIVSDLMQMELSNMFKIANNVSENVSAKVAVEIPPVALILGFILIGTWLFSFISNIFRYSGFVMKKDVHILRIVSGAFTKRIYHIMHEKINYVDLRQSLLMKIFNISSVNISCSGYGRSRYELPVLLPILTKNQTNKALDLLDFNKYLTDRKVKPERLSLWSYISVPTFFASAIPIAAYVASRFIPGISHILFSITVLTEIPLIWLIVVKIAAHFTTGITVEDDFCCIRYSRFYAFHTILADKSKLVKIQIFQDVIDEKIGRCRMDFYFNSELTKVNKVKGIKIADAKKIIEKFNV